MEATIDVIVKWPLGLHIRPITHLVKLLNQYSSNIQFQRDSVTCDAKSIMELLTLEAGKGDSIHVIANGNDSQQVVDVVSRFFSNYQDNNKIEPDT